MGKTFYRKLNSTTENVNKAYPNKEIRYFGEAPSNFNTSTVNEKRQISHDYRQMKAEQPLSKNFINRNPRDWRTLKLPGLKNCGVHIKNEHY